MAESLRKRNKLLIDMQERIFRDDRLVALGTLASGAAHELGTPLGTMDVIAHELERELSEAGEELASSKLSIIQGQIKRCKKVLSTITQTVTEEKYDGGQVLAVDQYISNVVAQWRVSHLSVNLVENYNGNASVPSLIEDIALTRALFNILDNAAQASLDYVSITVNWTDNRLTILIEDQGMGLGEFQLAKLGAQEMSSKESGLGVGIYITKATIERMNGEISWTNRKPNGVAVALSVPLIS
jgi:two-component system sensor histidine kinase RegB